MTLSPSLLLRLLFLIMIPLRRTLTLFPYTTLFRSDAAKASFDSNAAGLANAKANLQLATTALNDCSLRSPLRGWVVEREVEIDRKSTRLNSSHRCISYAVFCLKKKTENKRQRQNDN